MLNSTSAKEIEWHCKHYVGRGLMKKIEGGEALAKEIGCSAETLKKTCELHLPYQRVEADQLVDNHNHYAKNPGSDPFKKKFFHNSEWKMDDLYHVALMVSSSASGVA